MANAELWEPWTFAPGDRVRVRVSAECRESGHLDPANPEEWGWLDAGIGVVICVATPDHRRLFPGGHWYGVEMDSSRALSMRLFGVTEADLAARPDPAPDDWYAAVELERA